MEKKLNRYEMRSQWLATAEDLEKTDPILKSLVEIRDYTIANGTNTGFTTELTLREGLKSKVVTSANTVEISEWVPSDEEGMPDKHVITVRYLKDAEIVLGVNKIVDFDTSQLEKPIESKLYPPAIAYKVSDGTSEFPVEISGPIDSFGPNAKKFITEFLTDAKKALIK